MCMKIQQKNALTTCYQAHFGKRKFENNIFTNHLPHSTETI